MEKVNILGIEVKAINMNDAVSMIKRWAENREQRYVYVAIVNTIVESRKHKKFRDLINLAGLTTPDGMPLVWLSKLEGYRNVGRVHGPDLMLKFRELAEKRIFEFLLSWQKCSF